MVSAPPVLFITETVELKEEQKKSTHISEHIETPFHSAGGHRRGVGIINMTTKQNDIHNVIWDIRCHKPAGILRTVTHTSGRPIRRLLYSQSPRGIFGTSFPWYVPTLVQLMVYRTSGDKSLSEPMVCTQIAKFMGPTWGPPGAGRTQVGPMLAQWTLLSG